MAQDLLNRKIAALEEEIERLRAEKLKEEKILSRKIAKLEEEIKRLRAEKLEEEIKRLRAEHVCDAFEYFATGGMEPCSRYHAWTPSQSHFC